MEILGYFLALIMGFSLGLLGGGGSILTVPILVYVLEIDPVKSTAYSLFVVGITALVGGWQKHRQGLVMWREGILFAIPSLTSVFLTRLYVVPAIPDTLFTYQDFTLTKPLFVMLFFAIIMLLAGGSMLKTSQKGSIAAPGKKINIPVIIIDGIVVGTLTGIVGAGGGFLIVPALVILLKLPIKKAIGTSLIIIAIKSLSGFMGDIIQGNTMDWNLLAIFTVVAVLGMFVGLYVTRFVNQNHLKKIFGWFIITFAAIMIIKELL